MAGLTSPGKRPIKLAAIHPNAGLAAAYRRRLRRMVEEMHRSLLYWIGAAYRSRPPEMAQDASPAANLRAEMAALARRWQRRFDEAAEDVARHFGTAAANQTDAAMKAALGKAGFTVDFVWTREANDVLQACIGEQVGLIKSIASEHLTQVEGLVMRAVSSGSDLGTLAKQLEERYGVTQRRAAFIATDQNAKASAAILRVRQTRLGLKAIWLHSHGGRKPRPSHVAADGKEYDPQEGMLIDGEWILPGQKPRCRCISQSIIPVEPGF